MSEGALWVGPVGRPEQKGGVRTRSSLIITLILVSVLCGTLFLDERLRLLDASASLAASCFGCFLLAAEKFKVREARTLNSWLTPGFIACLHFAIQFAWGLSIEYHWDMLPWESSAGLFSNKVSTVNPETYHDCAGIILLGGLALFLGTLVRVPVGMLSSLVPDLPRRPDWHGLVVRAMIYLPFALICKYASSVLAPGVFQGTLEFFGLGMIPVCVVLCCMAFSKDKKVSRTTSLVAAIYVLAVAINGVLGGMIGGFLLPACLVCSGYVMARNCLPIRAISVSAVFLFLVAGPFLVAYKQSRMAEQLDISTAVAVSRGRPFETSYRESVEVGAAKILARTSGTFLAAFKESFPERFDYLEGESFLLELQSFVPRGLWPEKPNVSAQLDNYTRKVGLLGENDFVTSMVFDAMSEYYANWGYWGVAFLFFVEGIYTNILWRLLAHRGDPRLATSIIVAQLFAGLEYHGILIRMATDLRSVGVALCLYWMICPDGRRGHVRGTSQTGSATDA